MLDTWFTLNILESLQIHWCLLYLAYAFDEILTFYYFKRKIYEVLNWF